MDVSAIDAKNPLVGLSAEQLGRALGGLSAQEVRDRELQGHLFSVVRGQSDGGLAYPVFQAWPGISGAPLETLLRVFQRNDEVWGGTAYCFFAGVTDLLGDLTPIEALIGRLTSDREIDPEVALFLAAPFDERFKATYCAAEAHAASSAGG